MKFLDSLKSHWEDFKAASGRVFDQLWSVVSDYQRDADPWKIAGLVCFGVAVYLALQTLDLAKSGKDVSVVGIIGGLVVTVGGFGTFLMGQSHNVDRAMINGETTLQAHEVYTAVKNGGE